MSQCNVQPAETQTVSATSFCPPRAAPPTATAEILCAMPWTCACGCENADILVCCQGCSRERWTPARDKAQKEPPQNSKAKGVTTRRRVGTTQERKAHRRYQSLLAREKKIRQRKAAKARQRAVSSAICRDCGQGANVARRSWCTTAPPRCSACGGLLDQTRRPITA